MYHILYIIPAGVYTVRTLIVPPENSVLSVIFQILTSLKSLQLLNLSYFQNDFSDTEQKYYANFLVTN